MRARLRWTLVLALAAVVALLCGTTNALGLGQSTTSSTQAAKTGVVTISVRFGSS